MANNTDQLSAALTAALVKDMQQQVTNQVQEEVTARLNQLDLSKIVGVFVKQAVDKVVKEFTFPPSSIPAEAINFAGYTLGGNNVAGGLIKHFNSTGIQDDASSCQITVMDNVTVIENKLVSAGMEIRGNLEVDGDLLLTGEIPADSPFYKDLVEHAAGLLKLSMDGEFFTAYSGKVFDRIKADGIDLSTVNFNGMELLKGNKLGNFVTETNIQTLGDLRQLTVRGEALVFNTLYVGNKRVGINTTEPSSALSVWDEECELVARKHQSEVSMFGSARPQKVILSSNSKKNIELETDGSVTVNNLTVGKVKMSSSDSRPTTNEVQGKIVWNNNPEMGKHIGWVSLGNSRWAGFGKVE